MLKRIWRKRNYCTLLVGRHIYWCIHHGKTVWSSLKKLKIELPYDLGIPLLDIYTEKIIILKDICSPIFIAALFTRAKTWKHLNVHPWMYR